MFSVSFYSLAKDLSIPLIFNSFSIYLFIIFIYLIIFILVALGLCGAWAYLPQSVWDLSSPARDRTCILCIGRQIFNHWTTEEVSLLIFLFKLINVLLAALSPCCVRAFSSCGEYSWYRARASRCSGFSCCKAWAPAAAARRLQQLCLRGFSCSAVCGILPGQRSNHVPCIGRWTHVH